MYTCQKTHNSVNPVRVDSSLGIVLVRLLKASDLQCKQAGYVLTKGAILQVILVFMT